LDYNYPLTGPIARQDLVHWVATKASYLILLFLVQGRSPTHEVALKFPRIHDSKYF
jgi:hypothetical protein